MTKKQESSNTTAPKIINLKILTWFLGVSVIITLGLTLTQLNLVESTRIVFGSVFVLFVPGYFLSFVFFKEEIDWLERVAISFGLSISVVALVLFYLNYFFNLQPNSLVTTTVILIIIIISYLIIHIPSRLNKHI